MHVSQEINRAMPCQFINCQFKHNWLKSTYRSIEKFREFANACILWLTGLKQVFRKFLGSHCYADGDKNVLGEDAVQYWIVCGSLQTAKLDARYYYSNYSPMLTPLIDLIMRWHFNMTFTHKFFLMHACNAQMIVMHFKPYMLECQIFQSRLLIYRKLFDLITRWHFKYNFYT
jgi:hypothetical protein